ncbi:PAS domain S-box protein [Sorangium sp. So ce260]|uniref:PAS domain S-box protein n=1 Tax=Sorangium sp. So ce260 TaxID=3133291 RepID=UPI003F647038
MRTEEIEASISREEEVACMASPCQCGRHEARTTPGELMARAALGVARTADLDELAGLVLDQVMELGARAAYLLLASEDTGELGLHSHRHLPADIRLRLARVARGAPLLDAWAASAGRIQVMSDARSLDPGPSLTRELCARTGAQSAVSMPLCVRDRCLGVLSWYLPHPHPHAGVDLGTLAALFAIGLDSALARQGKARVEAQVEAVQRSIADIGDSSDLPAALQRVVDRARTVAGAEYAALGVYAGDDAPFDLWICSGATAGWERSSAEAPRPRGRLQAVHRDRRPLRLAELCADERFDGFSPEHPPLKSFLGTPLLQEQQLVGVLYLANKIGAAAFTEEDEGAATLLGQHAALALSRARAYDRMAQELRRTRHLERALRESEQRFRAIFDEAIQFVGLLSPEGVVLENNRAVLEFCGTTEAETIGRPFWELPGWSLEQKARVRAAVAEAAAGRLVRDELDVIGPSGRCCIDFSLKPITDDRGRVVMLIPEGRDITQRKQTEQALRESEERFRLTFENAPIGKAIVGLDGRFIRVNRAYCEILGYSAEELSTLRFQDITHPDDVDTDVGLAEQLRRGEIPRYQLAKRYLHKDGRVIPVILHGSIVRGEDGEPIHYIAQVEDVTARKQAEEERERLLAQLDAERRTLQTIFDNAPVPLVLIDRNGAERVIANPHALDLTGGVAERGQYVARLRHPDGTPVPLDELPSSRAMRGETIPGEELVVARADGSSRTFLVAAAPLRDSAGKITGAIVAGEDISPLKELARMREEWTSIIAHDLRQPITTIVLKASLLAKQPQSSDKARHILASATQLNRMISDLLDVSRLESHRLDLRPVEVDLPALIRATVERTADATRGHRVDVEVSDGVPPLIADPGRLEQVLTNLLSNAAKYGAPETPIRIAVERRGGEVLVAVENEGKGIAPEELPRLFARYHRTREAKAGGAAGLGLGLYIVRGLIEAHGGRVWAESAPGKTSFRFTLPLPQRARSSDREPW